MIEPENMNWYGGPQHKKQLYPVQKMKIKDHAFIPTDDYPIMERYWLNSRGVLFDVHYTTPLFVDQNTIQADRLCFTAKNELPYLLDDFNGGAFSFKYTIGFSTDAKKTHMNFVTTRFGLNKPRSIPNERLVKYPIWNTSVRYGRIINEQMITDFLSEISQNKFNYSMMIIDDFWEEKCYGSMKIDKAKFPDMKNLITELKKKHDGIAFSLWIHPFINKNCDPYYTIAKNNDYLVKTIDGSFDTTWWNSETNGAAHINFLNPEASNWFKNQLKKLKEESGVDTFKLVAGETNFFPANANTTLNRFLIMQNYLKISNDFGNMMELNSGLRTQYLSVFVRMEGLYSRWTSDNGLKALIPRLIQINLMGYYFILPGLFLFTYNINLIGNLVILF